MPYARQLCKLACPGVPAVRDHGAGAAVTTAGAAFSSAPLPPPGDQAGLGQKARQRSRWKK